MHRIDIIKTKIFLFIIIGVAFSCEKEEPVKVKETYESKPIDFSFADDIAGEYVGEAFEQNSNDFNDTNTYQLTVNVIDLRTDYECMFYIDVLNDTVLLSTNGYFTSIKSKKPITYIIGTPSYSRYFSDGKFYMKTIMPGYNGSYTSFDYTGIKVE